MINVNPILFSQKSFDSAHAAPRRSVNCVIRARPLADSSRGS